MNTLPQTVGRYRIIAKLGQGGMATALLAMSEGPGGFRKLSVVKQLRLDLCEDPAFIAMFLDEARIAALLNHPNVVQTNEVGEQGNVRFISMEYLQGQSLAKVLYRVRGKLPLALSLRVLLDTLTGLHYVHELADLSGKPLSVVHRDISPGNIFLTYDGVVKLLDFGIAKADGRQAETRAGSFKGKMAYVAPEQARTNSVDRRADIFATGVLLWETLAQRPLIPRDQSDAMTLQNRLRGLEPSIDDIAPHIPGALRAVCQKAMALDPAERYSSAAEFHEALELAGRNVGIASSSKVATVMSRLFEKEREAIAETIARTISTDAPFETVAEMASSWKASTGLSMSPVVLDDAITSELSRSDFTQVESEIMTGAAPPVPGSTKATVAVAMAGVLLAVGVVAYVLGAGNEESQAATVSAGQQVVKPEPAQTPVPDADDKIRLNVEVYPLDAIVQIDGEQLLSNPFAGNRLVATGEHQLVASAPGYETSTRKVLLDRDLTLSLSLTKTQTETLATETPLASPGRTLRRSDRSQRKRERRRAAKRRGLRSNDVDRAEAPVQATPSLASQPQVSMPTASKPTASKRKPGDALRQKNKTETRRIDKDNPYQ